MINNMAICGMHDDGDYNPPPTSKVEWRFLKQEELDFYTKVVNDYVEEKMKEWRSNWDPIKEKVASMNYMQVVGDFPASSYGNMFYEYTPHIGDPIVYGPAETKYWSLSGITNSQMYPWNPPPPRFNGTYPNQYLERESVDHLIFDFPMPGYDKSELSVIAKGNNIKIKACKTRSCNTFKTVGGSFFPPTYDFNFNIAEKYDATKSVVIYCDGMLYVDIPMNKKFKEEKEIKLL